MSNFDFKLLMNGFTIRAMLPQDIGEVRELIESAPGLACWDFETDENLLRSLARNPGLSQVALDWKTLSGRPEIVGCVIIGEGHMAMIHHLYVKPEARQGGNQLGTRMVRSGLKHLYDTANATRRVYITTLRTNISAQLFWSQLGATKQGHGELCTFTINLNDEQHRHWLHCQATG